MYIDYPEYAEINGKQYKIDTDFNVALKCFEIVEDDTITDYERAIAIVYLLFDFIPEDKDLNLFLQKASLFLQCGKDEIEQKSNKKDMDFVQDKNYINASFMSDYKIDLSKEKMHFWQFISLIEGLTENSALNRLRDFRNFDAKEIKDAKKRAEIIEGQKKVALKQDKPKIELTKEQQESMERLNKILGI